jgi:hypothetical protein
MTDTQNSTNKTEAVGPVAHPELSGLFDEMQALMALMPGAAFATGTQLSTEEETEAMFDNMPV